MEPEENAGIIELPSTATIPPPRPQSISEQPFSTVRHSKRLSLNFPILPPSATQSGRGSPSPRTTNVNPPDQAPETPTTSAGFLTALASQERKVLELREELQRAESDLNKLKRQWAAHEAQKKRSRTAQDAELQAVRAEVSKVDRDLVEESMGLSLLRREQDADAASRDGTRPRPRKVFSGSRNTRTLSLLSPDATNVRSSFPQPSDVDEPVDITTGIEDPNAEKSSSPPTLSRSSTISDSQSQPQPQQPKFEPLHEIILKRRSMPPPSTDALLRSSKQMASDFREGLWTFFEDLRQATVGDEAIHGTKYRTPSSLSSPANNLKHKSSTSSRTRQQHHSSKAKTSLRPLSSAAMPTTITSSFVKDNPTFRVRGSTSKATSVLGSGEGGQSALVDVDTDFWKEYGVASTTDAKCSSITETKASSSSQSRNAIDLDAQEDQGQNPSPSQASDYDNWDVWDSPLPQKKIISLNTISGANSNSNSNSNPHSSSSSDIHNNEIESSSSPAPTATTFSTQRGSSGSAVSSASSNATVPSPTTATLSNSPSTAAPTSSHRNFSRPQPQAVSPLTPSFKEDLGKESNPPSSDMSEKVSSTPTPTPTTLPFDGTLQWALNG